MPDSNPKRNWNLVKELKELDANSVNGINPTSPEDLPKHFRILLFDAKQKSSSKLEERINEMLFCNSFSGLDFQSGPGNMHTQVSVLWCSLCFQRIPF